VKLKGRNVACLTVASPLYAPASGGRKRLRRLRDSLSGCPLPGAFVGDSCIQLSPALPQDAPARMVRRGQAGSKTRGDNLWPE
jgi:hypothetical protein